MTYCSRFIKGTDILSIYLLKYFIVYDYARANLEFDYFNLQ